MENAHPIFRYSDDQLKAFLRFFVDLELKFLGLSKRPALFDRPFTFCAGIYKEEARDRLYDPLATFQSGKVPNPAGEEVFLRNYKFLAA